MSGTDAVARLKQLLDYVAATERDKLAIPTDVAGEKGFRIAGSELMMLPGVQLNGGGEGDPLWVRVERLTKVKPPRLADAELGLWADVADDPDRKPALKSEVPIAVLRAAGLIEGSPVAGEPASMPLNAYPGLERLRRHLDAFVREVWTPWADEERARRRSIKLYNDLFALRLALDGSSDTPAELVCGIGMAEWKRPLGRLSYPLLTVQLEVSIEEASHAIELRPRSESPPGVESDTLDKLDIAGVDEWRRFTIPYLEGLESGLSPFAADGFDPVLRKAVQLLDPSGVYLPDLREGQQPDPDSLHVGPSWLISRVRAGRHR
ncbi:hypothetical protein [Sphingomonas sp.]|jgi:hypothetical protein|uniref:hypothetical protein n=1 Tax=Sphingomonas sp. TaxID=28214 RepID=UPI002DEE845E|nr:hypothetical protein [Sphingomonas sp.]